EGAEKQADEVGKRRSELESQLAQNKLAQAGLLNELQELQRQLLAHREFSKAEQVKLEAKTRDIEGLNYELAAVRSALEHETLQRRKLAEQVLEVERAKAEVADQKDAANALVKAHENSICSLDLQVRERQGDLNRLEALLQSEMAQRRSENLRS